MITGLLKKIFGSRNERLIKQYRRKVAQMALPERKVLRVYKENQGLVRSQNIVL